MSIYPVSESSREKDEIDNPPQFYSDQEYWQQVYADFLEERRHLIDAKQEATKDLDQGIFALSGSLLALSITFVEKLAANPPRYIWALGVAWGLLLLSVLGTLCSFFFSRHAFTSAIRSLTEEYNLRQRDPEAPLPIRRNWSSIFTEGLNVIAIIACVVGVLFLASFTFFNLPYEASPLPPVQPLMRPTANPVGTPHP